MFVAFIALIVRTYMQNQLSDYMSEHKITFQKILLELDKVKLIHSASVCRKSEENAPQQSLPLMREVARRVGGREKAAISP